MTKHLYLNGAFYANLVKMDAIFQSNYVRNKILRF